MNESPLEATQQRSGVVDGLWDVRVLAAAGLVVGTGRTVRSWVEEVFFGF